LNQGLHFKTALLGVILRKTTRLSPAATTVFSSAKISNLLSTDLQRVESFIAFGHVLWTAPIQFSIITGLLIYTLGPSALVGIAILILLLPIQKLLMSRLERIRKEVAPVTDERVQLTREIITSLRILKYFAWEMPFSKKVDEIRAKELSLVLKRAYSQAMVWAVAFSVPVFTAASALIIYSLNNTLEPSKVFSSLALFNQLRFPLMFTPMAIVQFVEFKVALKRIEELLLAPEIESQVDSNVDEGFSVQLKNASFAWDSIKSDVKPPVVMEVHNGVTARNEVKPPLEPKKEETVDLKDISINFPKGKLTIVIGSVGSGKSTLLGSILGETKLISGQLKYAGKIGYAAQQSWLQNASIRENILFGLNYQEEKYRKVIRACALEKDLEMFPDGDMTEIGERGITLSGGQKQRINIARVLYFGSDIILMDDPLSAVDGKKILI
jgi:ABC-type multidrug transport system fused ATPase/permease subunit